MTKSRHKDTVAGPVAATVAGPDAGSGPVAGAGPVAATDADTATDTVAGTGSAPVADTDTATINPFKKGSDPFFVDGRWRGRGEWVWDPLILGANVSLPAWESGGVDSLSGVAGRPSSAAVRTQKGSP